MKDRHLFRGMLIDSRNIFAIGYLIPSDQGRDVIVDGCCEFDIRDGTLGQCLGIRDINGILIFEGDIIHYGYYGDDESPPDLSRPMNFPVRWSEADGGWLANGRLRGNKEGIYPRKIIGTIHDE